MRATAALDHSSFSHDVRITADQLRGESLYLVSTGVIPLLLLWFVELSEARKVVTWLPPLALLALCGASIVLARRRPAFGALVLVSSLVLGDVVFLGIHGGSAPAYFFGTIVMAGGALLGPLAAVVLAGVASVIIVGAALIPTVSLDETTTLAAIALVWFAVVVAWASSYPVYAALAWAWNSYHDALRQREELRDRQGELNRALASLSETCYRLEVANQELARARAAAEEARQLKTEFAANISHELRTPLNLIIGFSEILMTTPGGAVGLSPEARADVDVIYRNARHLSNLIDDVLDLSQVDAGRMGLHKERTALAPIVAEAISAVARLYEARGLTLHSEVPDDLPPVYVDRTRIRQVLINLLNNAARFTPSGGATVSAGLAEGSLVVHVADTGVGIAAEDIPKVFEEFRQLDGSTRRPHDGSGLGLAICRRFVELHGGTIWAESAPGQGTVFSFTLPLIDNVASATLRQEWDTWVRLPTPAEPPSRAVVLVTHDSRIERLFERYLDGYCVVSAADEAAAIRAFHQAPVHGVVLTASPDAPLNERLHRLREAPRNVPIVVCSLPTSESLGERLGVCDYLVKPISAERLHETIGRVRPKARTILVVDDDPEMVRLLARMLRARSHRYQVVRAYGGAAALALLRERRPDIVILDLVMPEIDGYAVLREMRATDELRDLPVIAVTARSQEAETVAAGALEITREGGLSLRELMACLKASLDAITTPAGTAGAPRPELAR